MQLPDSVVDERAPELQTLFAEAALGGEVEALSGARATLERLERAGIRRALICDTGFSPGRVVRQLLERLELLALLEVHVFSDETGVSKPHARMFERALTPLSIDPSDAVHVGDLRRTDVAGARAFGMRSVRIRDYYDDDSRHPEADEVAESHEHLCEILGLR
jgi:putative hydrolase of the HAD superfamily